MRPIIRIDEEKCDGCGLCAAACHEGAIAILDGKARLVSETYCDGLGDCLGECPQGAITIEEREAGDFDRNAVARAMAEKEAGKAVKSGCPGSMARSLKEMPKPDLSKTEGASSERLPGNAVSRLGNWPVQLSLVPVNAPYLKGASLLIAADCTTAACPDFHERFLEGNILLMGCPKLDDASFYEEKLSTVLAENKIADIEVVTMEVPCCGGLVRLVQAAIEKNRLPVSLVMTKMGIDGTVIGKETVRYRFA